MQAYEFQTTARDGFIKIPDEYVRKIGSEIRVILFPADEQVSKRISERRSLMDLVGVLKDVGDVDLEKARMERLQKYENPD